MKLTAVQTGTHRREDLAMSRYERRLSCSECTGWAPWRVGLYWRTKEKMNEEAADCKRS